MPKYQFNGDHQSITIEGTTFVKGQVKELSSDELKQLQASGFWKPLFENGELVEVKDESKPSAKTTTKATTAADEANKAE